MFKKVQKISEGKTLKTFLEDLRNNEVGFSLLDMTLAIAVMMILVSAGILGYPAFQSWEEETTVNVGTRAGYASALNTLTNQWDGGTTVDEVLSSVEAHYDNVTFTYTGTDTVNLCVTGTFTDDNGEVKYVEYVGNCGDLGEDGEDGSTLPPEDDDGDGGGNAEPEGPVITDEISTFTYQCDSTTTGYLSLSGMESGTTITLINDHTGTIGMVGYSTKTGIFPDPSTPKVVSDLVTMQGGVPYTVLVDGKFDSIQAYVDESMGSTLRGCVTGITKLGDDSGLKRINTFAGGKLTNVPASIPDTVTSLDGALAQQPSFNDADVSTWDVSNVTSMQMVFAGSMSFNQDLSGWNTGNATSFYAMFAGAMDFNQDLSSWNVSSGQDFSSMFASTLFFNSPLNDWDTSSAKDMAAMFQNSMSFNQDLNNWNMSKVHKTSGMFQGATSFNGQIDGWNLSELMHADYMFSGASAFNQPVNSITFGKLLTIEGIFRNATSFNQPVSSWNVSGVNRFDEAFNNAISFNQQLPWDVSSGKNFTRMFNGAVSFNQPLVWNTSNATNLREMFYGASAFNQDLSSWNTSKVIDSRWMFKSAASFNNGGISDLNSWDVSKITNMSEMFSGAASFNADITQWKPTSSKTFNSMFRNAVTFNQDLSGWGTETGAATNFGKMFENSLMSYDLSGWDVSSAMTFLGFESPYMTPEMIPAFP